MKEEVERTEEGWQSIIEDQLWKKAGERKAASRVVLADCTPLQGEKEKDTVKRIMWVARRDGVSDEDRPALFRKIVKSLGIPGEEAARDKKSWEELLSLVKDIVAMKRFMESQGTGNRGGSSSGGAGANGGSSGGGGQGQSGTGAGRGDGAGRGTDNRGGE